MKAIEGTIRQLTGAVNAQSEHVKKLEVRLAQIETQSIRAQRHNRSLQPLEQKKIWKKLANSQIV